MGVLWRCFRSQKGNSGSDALTGGDARLLFVRQSRQPAGGQRSLNRSVFDVNQAFAAKLVYASELADPPKHKRIRAKFYS